MGNENQMVLPPSTPRARRTNPRIPALRLPRPVEVDGSGLASWATTLPLYAADERATIPA